MKSVRRLAKKTLLHVVPHPENNHVPHLLSPNYLLGILVSAAIVFSLVSWGIPQSQRWGLTAEVYANVLVDLTNEAREDNNLPALVVSETLTNVATLKAQDMSTYEYFAHTSPQGVTPWYWFDKAGYPFSYAGENLAVDFERTKDVHKALLASPTHRANILSNNFTEIGIATYGGTYKGHDTTFVVESFGTPLRRVATTPTGVAVTSPLTQENQPDVVLGETAETKPLPPSSVSPKPTQVEVLHEDAEFTVARNSEVAPDAPLSGNESKNVASYSTWYQRFLMNPSGTTTTVLLVFAAILLCAIIAMLVHEAARKKVRTMVYGAGVIALIMLLVGIGNLATFPALTIQ